MGTIIDFTTLINGSSAYQQAGSAVFDAITQQQLGAQAAIDAFEAAGGTVVRNAAGDIIQFSKATSAGKAASGIGAAANSNAIGASNAAKVFSAGKATLTGGKAVLSSVGSFLAKTVAPATAAVSIGITLGKSFDAALYKLNPGFLHIDNIEAFNPEVFATLAADDYSLTGRAFNFLFNTNANTGTMQAYAEDQTIAYLAAYLQASNALASSDRSYPTPTSPAIAPYTSFLASHHSVVQWTGGGGGTWSDFCNGTSDDAKLATLHGDVDAINGFVTMITASEIQNPTIVNETSFEFPRPNRTFTHNGQTVYYATSTTSSSGLKNVLGAQNELLTSTIEETSALIPAIAWVMVYGLQGSGNITGVSDQQGAVVPDLTNVPYEDVFEFLKQTLPSIFTTPLEVPTLQPDGEVVNRKYYPVSLPENATETLPDNQPAPQTGTSTQADPQINANTSPKTMQDAASETATEPAEDLPEGSGVTPTIVTPSGSASALFTVYNPTQAQLNSFGSWLWSSNFVDQLKKLFNDPMQAIIGLHKVFATPTLGTASTIHCGYIDSQVASNVVGNQYATVNCGSVDCQEYFGNVFDYGATQIKLYLPFIGIVPLDVANIMRSTITVKYTVDVLTGACLAEVNVQRDAVGGVLYTFSGNCAVQYPVSSGSYMGIVAGISSIVGSAAATIASGGTLAPLLFGTAASAAGLHSNISHSGAISGNAGAMGGKKPYLIISRPQVAMPAQYPNLQGIPSNSYQLLNTLIGFVRVKECHLENVPATSEELAELERILKTGVIL